MSILGRLLRYVQSNGYPLSPAEVAPKRKRRKGYAQGIQSIEQMEPRLLFTTVFGGEIFRYTDARGTIVQAQVNGNTTVAELIGAIQSADDGSLLFGNIGGTIVQSSLTGRAGLIIGNGTVEVSGNEATGSRTNITDPIVPGDSQSVATSAGNIAITGLASNPAGATYGFNVYNSGNASVPAYVFQVLQFNNSTGAANVIDHLETDPTFQGGVPAATSVTAAAFDPSDGLLYFVVRGENFTGNSTTSDTVETLWSIDVTNNQLTQIPGTFNDANGTNEITSITFNQTTDQAGDPETDLWLFRKNGNSTQNGASQLLEIAAFDPTVGTDVRFNAAVNVTEGYVAVPPPVTAITGISFIPGDSTHIYAIENTGATSHLLRISTTSGAATNWGSLTDQVYANFHKTGNQAIAGNNLVGLTWDPNITNPFTGTNGVLEATDTATNDLVFIDGRLRINAGDVYSVYTNQADMSSSITFQTGTINTKGQFTSNLYKGNFGSFAPTTIDGVTVTVPGNIGAAYLGFLGNLPDPNNAGKFTTANPFLSGNLTSSIGIFPSVYSTDPNALPTSIITPGVTVGYSLESFANVDPTATLAQKLLGQNFNSVHGLAIANDGTIAVMNTDSYGNFVAGDQLAFVNPTSGAIVGAPINVTDSFGDPLKNVQGLAYGAVNLDGNEQLYAIYDLGDGNGPTLGTIDTTTGIFTAIGALGLGANARVTGMAFSSGGTGFDAAHQGLFVAYDANQLDSDPTNTLAQIDPTTGLTAGDIGPVVDSNNGLVTVGSMTFDGGGNLLVQDESSGQLLNLGLDTTTATATLNGTTAESAAGGLNPTIGAIAFDIATNQFYAVDNMTGTTNGVASQIRSSAALMILKDPTQVNSDTVNLGGFLFDGTVTGKVFVSGSIGTFYAGWIITGDASDALAGGQQWIGPVVDLTDNFQVDGDLRNLLSLSSIGTDGSQVTNGIPDYNTGTQVEVAGQIGNVNANGMIDAIIHASDLATGIPNVGDGTSLIGFGGQIIPEPLPILNPLTNLTTDSTTLGTMTVNGNASIAPGVATIGTNPLTTDTLTLATEAGSIGSAFSSVAQSIDSFTASFVYNATNVADEGAAFVLQNAGTTTLSTTDGTTGLGYQGLTHSAAILFNINAANGGPETGIGINGNMSFVSTGNVDIASGDNISVFLSYNGSVLTETLLDSAANTTFTTSYAVDLATVLGSHTALVGFTGASTTGATATIFTTGGQTITNFQFTGGGTPQTEIEKWSIGTKAPYPAYTFGAGNLVDLNGITPFDNTSFAGAEYLGTIQNYTSGQPDVIDVNGELQALSAKGTLGPDPVDYYGVSLLAGQTIQVTATAIIDQYYLSQGLAEPADAADINVGIFDPDGRLIATDYSDVDPTQVQGKTVQITADRPGVYRIAVAIDGDTNFSLTPPNSFVFGDFGYNLQITGVGNLAIGGVVAGGAVVLNAAGTPTIDLNTLTEVITPSIQADTGDIGAIVAGQRGGNANGNSVLAPFGISGLVPTTTSAGAILEPGAIPTGDITTDNGSLRAVVGSSIGLETTTLLGYAFAPDFDINGTVGLLQATGAAGGVTALVATFGNAATGEIQRIDSAGDVGGFYRTDKGIGTVDAATMKWGSSDVEFHVNVDGQGSDGIIDYIGVSGDLGTLQFGGPAIITGPGGDLRILDVGGAVYQDTFFAVGNTTNLGQIIHGPGLSVTLTDDSGAVVLLTPGQVVNPLAGQVLPGSFKAQPATIAGQLTTTAYGIRGAGGVAIINVTSTSGLTVSVTAGGNGRSAEIGTITTGGAGIPLTFLPSGVPTVVTAGATALVNNVTITSTGGAKVDVFNITNGGGGTIDSISNTTGGDLLDINAGDVGSIFSHGNIGSMSSTSGGIIIPVETFSNAYPFVNQHFGVTVGNVGTLASDKAIGNIIASGVIGTITANKDGIDDPNTFEGIDGPIVINGSNVGTTVVPGTVVPAAISVTQVNIGDGIAASGSGAMSKAGIYAAGRIMSVTGTNADIRGNIVSTSAGGGIGNITLTNGSIINANIMDVGSYAQSSELSGAVTLPSDSADVDHPVYEITNITINGNGGIIGSIFEGSSIGNITVSSSGFGILDSVFSALADGVINSIVAGGYGIRDTTIDGGARVGTISAMGSGAASALTNYEIAVRLSEHNAFDPYEGFAPNRLTDLDIYMNGDGTALTLPDPAGLTTGVIETLTVTGQDSLGNLSAFTITNSTFNFANSVGNVTVRSDLTGFEIISGSLASLKVLGNATDLNVQIAGKIGNVTITGNFLDSGLSLTPTGIIAKGPSGDIGAVVVGGDFGSTLSAEGRIASITIGTPGVGVNHGTGDFFGNISIQGNTITTAILDLLKLYGSITGGTIILNGNVGTIDIASDLGGLAQDLLVGGNLAALKVGTDTRVNGSSISAPVTIAGNLGTGTVTGFMSAVVTVQGNSGAFSVIADPVTIGGDLVTNTGGLTVGGTLTSFTATGGSVGGGILAGNTISAVTITNGNLDSGAQIASSLGNLTKLTITNGSLNGSVLANNGAISGITITGAGQGVGVGALISARSTGPITMLGDFNGDLNVTGAAGTLTARAITNSATINVGSFTTITAKGDISAAITSGVSISNESITSTGNLGGVITLASPASISIAGNMLADSSITTTSNLTTLSVKGAMTGDVFVDGAIGTFSAGSITNSVITSGFGITSFTVTGAVTNSLVQAGLARGADHQFGTNDLGEQPRMADITTVSVGLMVGSIIATGGNIGSFKSKGTLTNSSVSAGLVLDGDDIENVITDNAPLSTLVKLNAARADATLFHGNVTSATVGTTGITMINSALTAGVSPGADGDFLTAGDNNVSSSLTGGISKFGSVKAGLDGTSVVLANSASTGVTPVTVVKYTLDGTANSIIQADPINLAQLVATATSGHPATYTLDGQTITIKISGPATASVKLYDNGANDGVANSLVIDGGGSTSAVSVTVTTSAPGILDIGRVLTTDGTVVSSFIFNGDIEGDGIGGPALYIDSDISTLSFRNMPNDTTWSGFIGGNVSTLTLNTQGPGLLRIGGAVKTFTVSASVGNPLLQQLGAISVVGGLTQLAFDPSSGDTFGIDGLGRLDAVDPVTGVVTVGNVVHIPGSTNALTLNGLTFDTSGNLYGVTTINNLQPVVDDGSISDGDQLRGLAVNSQGVVYAVDSSSGQDTLVTLTPNATGNDETVIGVLRDPNGNTFSNNVLALAFDSSDNLIVLLNDRDGIGGAASPSSGVAIARIATTDPNHTGFVRVSNPTSAGGALGAIIIVGPDTDNFTGLAVDSTNHIWAISNDGTADTLNQITITGNGAGAAASITPVGGGPVQINGNDTALIGIGFDENGNLVGLNANADDNTTCDLITISTTDPTNSSAFLTSTAGGEGLIDNEFAGFALGKSGTTFTSYAFTTDPTNGGELFTSTGPAPTLGLISTSGPDVGAFVQLMPLVQDDVSTPLAGTVRGIAADDSGDIFVVTSSGVLAEYDTFDGSLENDGPLGFIRDSISNNVLDISQIAFDGSGDLIGLNAQQNRLVTIDTDSFTFNGQNAVSASALTNFGTVDAPDLTAFTFSTDSGTFISYSLNSGNIVSLLGTAPDSVGGVIANSFGTVSLPGQYGGRIAATGASTGNSITSVKITGLGTFSGDVETPGSIGTVTTNGAIFDGAVVAGGNLTSASLIAGAFGADGVVSAGGKLGTFTFDGKGISNFAGTILAGNAGTITVKGEAFAGSLIEVSQTVSTLSITGAIDGVIQVGTVTTFTVGGALTAGSSVLLTNDSGTVKLNGGVDDGALFIANQGLTTLTIGGTLAGVVATRRSVGNLTLTNAASGVLTVGGDIKTLTVLGNVTDSIISSGVWIGPDGIYNTTDDVIFGGSITTASIKGIWQDSLLTAGVLPGINVDSGDNNIPTDFNVFNGTFDGTFSGSSAAEAGGIAPSKISAITFLHMVISTSAINGVFSGLVTAGGVGTVKDPLNSDLTQITLSNPIGYPQFAVDPTTLAQLVTPILSTDGLSTLGVKIVFNKLLDTDTLDPGNFTFLDINQDDIDPGTLTLSYATQTAADGSLQGVVTILSSNNFDGNTQITLNINTKVLDRTGTRSALYDFNQDGVTDTTEDPFGGPVVNGSADF